MKKKILFGWNGFSNGTVIFYSALAQLQFDCLLIFSYFTNSQEDETAFYSQWKSLGYDLNTYHHQNVSIYHRWHQVTWFLGLFFIIRNLCIMLVFDDPDELKEQSFCTLTQFFYLYHHPLLRALSLFLTRLTHTSGHLDRGWGKIRIGVFINLYCSRDFQCGTHILSMCRFLNTIWILMAISHAKM